MTPRSWYIDANSTPTAPAPTTITLLRQRVRGQDVVRGDDPLAVRARARAATSPASPWRGSRRCPGARARRRRPGLPSSPAIWTRTLVGPSRRPLPWIQVTLFLSTRLLTPVHMRLTTWSRRFGHPRVVDGRIAGHVDAEVLGVADPLGERRGLEQGLGRDAAAVEARAADLGLVDEGDLEARAGLRGMRRCSRRSRRRGRRDRSRWRSRRPSVRWSPLVSRTDGRTRGRGAA